MYFKYLNENLNLNLVNRRLVESSIFTKEFQEFINANNQKNIADLTNLMDDLEIILTEDELEEFASRKSEYEKSIYLLTLGKVEGWEDYPDWDQDYKSVFNENTLDNGFNVSNNPYLAWVKNTKKKLSNAGLKYDPLKEFEYILMNKEISLKDKLPKLWVNDPRAFDSIEYKIKALSLLSGKKSKNYFDEATAKEVIEKILDLNNENRIKNLLDDSQTGGGESDEEYTILDYLKSKIESFDPKKINIKEIMGILNKIISKHITKDPGYYSSEVKTVLQHPKFKSKFLSYSLPDLEDSTFTKNIVDYFKENIDDTPTIADYMKKNKVDKNTVLPIFRKILSNRYKEETILNSKINTLRSILSDKDAFASFATTPIKNFNNGPITTLLVKYIDAVEQSKPNPDN